MVSVAMQERDIGNIVPGVIVSQKDSSRTERECVFFLASYFKIQCKDTKNERDKQSLLCYFTACGECACGECSRTVYIDNRRGNSYFLPLTAKVQHFFLRGN